MKRLNLIVKAAIFFLALSSIVLAQEPAPPAAKPAGPTVQLSLIVTDSKNKSLNQVSKDDVHVIEDKVEQRVLSIAPDERPVDLVLAIDSSNSLRSLMRAVFETAALIVVNRRPEDEILLMRFISSDKIEKLTDFTRDGDALMAGLKAITIEGGQSAVIDALYVGAGVFADFKKASPDRRKVVVIVTDGEDRNSVYKQEALVKKLHQSDVQVFALGLVTELDRESGLVSKSPRDKAEKLLRTVTEETGGRAFFPRNRTELLDSMTQIINDLRGQFRLTYQSSNGEKKGFRNVEVKLISPSGEKRKAIVPRGYEAK
ncbi:MAG TPA: VWA domain-containing protein [Pyrinomonadaceae bacterium]|jgi:VWFA-related protein